MLIILVLVSASCGAFFTGLLNQVYGVPVVRSSALSSLVLAGTLYFAPLFATESFNELVTLVFFGASFNGMTSKTVLPLVWLTISGFFFGLFFLVSSSFFAGFGGGLGMAACITVLIGLGLKHAWEHVFVGLYTNMPNRESARVSLVPILIRVFNRKRGLPK